jgi:enoyl-CoA hydratase/carnithine racemase
VPPKQRSAANAPDDSPVIFDEVVTRDDLRLGFARLNREKALNALSAEMFRLLHPQLRIWADDPRIACVILHGAGEKAFCAGGDVRSVYHAIKAHSGPAPNPTALELFRDEYRLDYFLHRYPKPLLVWGSGIVLGGGLGLMVGASHRVVTETSRIGMPEISIGFFPDVGGSWFLQRMPGRSGLFMALTGSQINGHDAIVGGLADYFVRSSDRDALFARLAAAPWSSDADTNRLVLSEVLQEFTARAASLLPVSNLQRHRELIETICRGDSLQDIVGRITYYDGEDAWLRRAAETLAAGSPTSAALSYELQRRARTLDLASTFRLELGVTVQCCARHDFCEGVRALLIDKDHNPKWQPAELSAVTSGLLEQHFLEPAWPDGRHPLADL